MLALEDLKDTPLIALMGPTAVGKTEIALQVAERFGCEIVGVDSVQIYQVLEIGTAKPSLEDRNRVRHHLVDYIQPDEPYNAVRFTQDAVKAIQNIVARGQIPLLAGGTGLYFDALLQGMFQLPQIPPHIRTAMKQRLKKEGHQALYAELIKVDPKSAARIHANDSYRIVRALEIFAHCGQTWSTLIKMDQERKRKYRTNLRKNVMKIGLERPREELYDRINLRTRQMIDAGLIEEVRGLLQKGYPPELHSLQTLGYRHIINYLQGNWSLEEATELLARDTRHYAKRQLTWFRRDNDVLWFHPDNQSKLMDAVDIFIKNRL